MDTIAIASQGRRWSSATYSAWNEWLVEHTFSRHQTSEPVAYIPASPEELCEIVGARREQASDVLGALTKSIIAEIDGESSSFANYCTKYRRPECGNYWSVQDYQEPYFFACLWLTCLVASGYPAYEGTFHSRMAILLGRKINLSSTELGSLDDVWQDVAQWTRRRSEKYRELILPPRDDYRRVIGRSFYLAFPNQNDRQQLWQLLQQKELLGIEPPISLVVEALLGAKSRFSTYFQDELALFVENFLENDNDPRNSVFWRAVRQAAVTPRLEAGNGTSRNGFTVLMAGFDQDELLEPYVACTEDFAASGFKRQRLDIAAGRFQYRIEPESAVSPSTVFASLLTGASRRAFAQGVIPLLEIATAEYRVAQGEQITECDLALVRNDRVDAFIRAFGGAPRESALDGWMAIEPDRLHQVDPLPPGLTDVTLLLPTTEPQRPHFVGGLRTSTGEFYRAHGYMPRIRAPGADRVELRVDDIWVACTKVVNGEESAPEWLVPESVSLDDLDELRVAATWRVSIEGHSFERAGEVCVPLADWNIGTDYKGVPPGAFWLETTSRQLRDIRGPLDEVPLGIMTLNRAHSMDMLYFDATARWLGPGVGEMSLVPRLDFQWIAIGPKKAPSAVVFIGDATQPILPDGAIAPDSNDRRHWKQAFSARKTFVHTGADYVPLSACPEVMPIHAAYAKAAAHTNAKKSGEATGRECVPIHLNTLIDDEPRQTNAYSESSRILVDVLASIAFHRSGAPLREVHDHLARITGTREEHSLRYHLIRALAESGMIDTLLRIDGRQTVVVARKPRLIAYRVGHRFRATVVGLVPAKKAEMLTAEAARLGVETSFTNAPNTYQPPIVRLEAKDGSLQPLEAISREMACEPLGFLDWPDSQAIPAHFRVCDALQTSLPPEMYEKDAVWCWKAGAFLRIPGEPGASSVERRRYQALAPIYVIVQDGVERAWSHSRAWALLDAAERSGRKPFALDSHGCLHTVSNSPLHLPLPLARLCAIVGNGAPGPKVDGMGDFQHVIAYRYPFGKKLIPLVLRAIPSSWI